MRTNQIPSRLHSVAQNKPSTTSYAARHWRKLNRVNFRKDFWDFYYWLVRPSNDPRNHCATHFGSSSLHLWPTSLGAWDRLDTRGSFILNDEPRHWTTNVQTPAGSVLYLWNLTALKLNKILYLFHWQTCDPCIQRQTDKRKRKRAATSSLTSPTHAQQKEQDIEDGASPRKRSRVGRAILVPRRFRDEPEGRQH